MQKRNKKSRQLLVLEYLFDYEIIIPKKENDYEIIPKKRKLSMSAMFTRQGEEPFKCLDSISHSTSVSESITANTIPIFAGSASATKEIPGGGGFTADINHWNKHLTDTEEKHRHFEKVKGIYRFTKEDEGDNADKVS